MERGRYGGVKGKGGERIRMQRRERMKKLRGKIKGVKRYKDEKGRKWKDIRWK